MMKRIFMNAATHIILKCFYYDESEVVMGTRNIACEFLGFVTPNFFSMLNFGLSIPDKHVY